jgi:heat shock protein HspQ
MREKTPKAKSARSARRAVPLRAKVASKSAAARTLEVKRNAKAETKPKAKVKRRASRRREPLRARFALGDVVRHRIYPFRGVIFDIDPVFANTEEWWLAIPEQIRPKKDQPFYHLLAENEETEYIAYVSEQNLVADESGEPLRHPRLSEFFTEDESGRLRVTLMQSH